MVEKFAKRFRSGTEIFNLKHLRLSISDCSYFNSNFTYKAYFRALSCRALKLDRRLPMNLDSEKPLYFWLLARITILELCLFFKIPVT